VRSFITNVANGASLAAGGQHEIRGIAFDGGYGIQRVLVSTNGGQQWQEAQLGPDHGNYSFREWSAGFSPPSKGDYRLMAMAVNRNGESQRMTPRWNPSGYMRNVIETVDVKAV